MKRFYEEGKLDKKWVENYYFRNGKNCKRLEMVNEGLSRHNYMLPNGEINESLK